MDYEVEDAKFTDLKGKIILKLEGLHVEGNDVYIECGDGSKFKMHHYQSCCESCSIEDIAGSIEDILGSEVLLAEEVTSHENPEGVTKEYQNSFTWTFYKLSTIKGSITIRWYGRSTGYYSESVSFDKIK